MTGFCLCFFKEQDSRDGEGIGGCQDYVWSGIRCGWEEGMGVNITK